MGGASVEFLSMDIDKIEDKVRECPKNKNIWVGNDLVKRTNELVHDYTKRHFIDEPGFKDVKVFHPPKISNELSDSKRGKSAVSRFEQRSKSEKIHPPKTKYEATL